MPSATQVTETTVLRAGTASLALFLSSLEIFDKTDERAAPTLYDRAIRMELNGGLSNRIVFVPSYRHSEFPVAILSYADNDGRMRLIARVVPCERVIEVIAASIVLDDVTCAHGVLIEWASAKDPGAAQGILNSLYVYHLNKSR